MLFIVAAKVVLFAKENKPDLTGIYGPDVKTIGIPAISSKVPMPKFAAITNRLAKAGYLMKVAPNVAEKTVAPAERRARLLEELWLDPDVDILVFACGGSGASDVVEVLDWEKLRKRDMRVIGFSDLTIMINMMLHKGVGHPYSGPVLTTLSYSSQAAVNRMRDMMNDKPSEVKLKPIKAAEKNINGLAMGGLLERLHRLANKGILNDLAGRILFIENTKRYAHRTEELLNDMIAKGVFNKAAGVVICDFNANAPKSKTIEILNNFASKIPCPVYAQFPYGHIPETSIIDFRRPLVITPEGILSWQK
ncbi:MAG: LD-carboxypeptidase [Kiritimatiellae bacterium]|nr:LD-carboxypeptidase [Kiritimatiellia bacterium]